MNNIFIFIIPVIRCIVTERNIADNNIHTVIEEFCLFISLVLNACVRVEQTGYSCGYTVKFNTVQLAVAADTFGELTVKVTCTHRRIKYLTALKAKAFKGMVYAVYDVWIGIKGGKGAGSCCCVIII